MKFLLNAPDFTCTCGARFETRGDAAAHVESGRCPRQGPSSSSAFMTWARTTGRAWLNRPKNAAEAERREKLLERARALKDNPEYAANAAAKREAERMAKDRARAMEEKKTIAKNDQPHEDPTNTQGRATEQARIRETEDDMAKKKSTKRRTKAEKKAKRPAGERKPRAPKTPKAPKEEKPFEIPSGFTSGQELKRTYLKEEHVVTVRASGFEYKGKDYRTLGAIADLIVGRHVSGPAFFGLWKPPAEKKAKRRHKAEAAPANAEAAPANAEAAPANAE
jgi:hypothetical protein